MMGLANKMLDKAKVENYLKEFVFDPSKPQNTKQENCKIGNWQVPFFSNEFWTPKQRQGSSLHEISYRACFKPQLANFFIKLFTDEKDLVYDPFAGRGTTAIEAALNHRVPFSNDINPLSKILAYPRIKLVSIAQIEQRLQDIDFDLKLKSDIDLSMFYHRQTEAEILALKKYLQYKKNNQTEDNIDAWIRMVATNRLTGHSRGFFSVYTLPPNQAVSAARQEKINEKRQQIPEYKSVKALILKKSKQLLKGLTKVELKNICAVGNDAIFLTKDARQTKEIKANSVQLIVTSPPFLDVVKYSSDNWLRLWFNDLNSKEIESRITVLNNIQKWSEFIGEAFNEFYRIVKTNGWVAFEVGEVRKGSIRLEEYVIPRGIAAGFSIKGVIVNQQNFTKTANIWGISNNKRGTNSNRIVLFVKE